ncbi:hypothetical protein ES288_D13G053000v1 [Gossypium darwinii]|uniref:Uncharacterized protein n=1 Tax=Gossypium darwinii TaxID=34276 RepID=A0A5D1ZUN1_GOSDA|nr:hypothetical protein ES288_D13G053000v1 [Gossypium darwinii]
MEGSLVIDQKDMIVIVHTQDEKGLIRIKGMWLASPLAKIVPTT